MTKKDDLLCVMINAVVKIISSININRTMLLKKSRESISVDKNKRLFIILNGPSVKKQDLSLLKGEECMFVNRGFLHPQYSIIKPKYHVFVDKKMLTGEWDVHWLDEIVDINPEVIFIMPVSWSQKSKFREFINKGYNFYWIPFNTPASCLGVSGYCFDFAIKWRIRNVYFVGFDATGLANEILKTSSHFYGTNEENEKKSTKDYIQDFYMFSRHLSDLHKIAAYAKRHNVNLVNATEGGLLDMFDRVSFSDLFESMPR